MTEYARVCQSMPEYAILCQGMQKYARVSSLNIPIETPTNVMNQLDFNALMDGRTGLTPTNILKPIMVNMTTSSSSSSSGLLQTPTVSTPSCGSQQRTNRSTVLQELGSPNTGGHLVSL